MRLFTGLTTAVTLATSLFAVTADAAMVSNDAFDKDTSFRITDVDGLYGDKTTQAETPTFDDLMKFMGFEPWGFEGLTPMIKSNVPRYQEIFPGQKLGAMRVVVRSSEYNGNNQQCFIAATPDRVVHMDQSNIPEGTSREDIARAFVNGDYAQFAQPMWEQDRKNGVKSNAQYLRADGNDETFSQAGHPAKHGFMAVFDGNNVTVHNGSSPTASQAGSAYMTVFNGVQKDIANGSELAIYQGGNTTETTSYFGAEYDQSETLAACNASLQDPEVQEELRRKESPVLTFKSAVLPQDTMGYDRIKKALTEQARGRTAEALESGEAQNVEVIANIEATAVKAAYPYGLVYNHGENTVESYGCYMYRVTDKFGNVIQEEVSRSFLNPEITSCNGNETAKLSPPEGEKIGEPNNTPPGNNGGKDNDKDKKGNDKNGGWWYLSGGSSSKHEGDTTFGDTYLINFTKEFNITNIYECDCETTPVPVGPALPYLVAGVSAFGIARLRRRPS